MCVTASELIREHHWWMPLPFGNIGEFRRKGSEAAIIDAASLSLGYERSCSFLPCYLISCSLLLKYKPSLDLYTQICYTGTLEIAAHQNGPLHL